MVPDNDGNSDRRPRTRDECRHGDRPCPWVSCRYHLYLDINPRTGSIKLNHPNRELWDLDQTCALDIAESGEASLDEISHYLNLTRERVRQMTLEGIETVGSKLFPEKQTRRTNPEQGEEGSQT